MMTMRMLMMQVVVAVAVIVTMIHTREQQLMSAWRQVQLLHLRTARCLRPWIVVKEMWTPRPAPNRCPCKVP